MNKTSTSGTASPSLRQARRAWRIQYADSSSSVALKRADDCALQAKRAGRNRVL